MKKTFRPQPANSVGLITNYKCTFQCKHCLYCSSPSISEEADEEMLVKIINETGDNLKYADLHIGGGEPLLKYESLKRLVSLINKRHIPLEYVETNGFLLMKDTENKLKDLKASGVNRLLLSISPFHNEFISAKNIKKLCKDILSVLGYDGLFPWNQGYFYFLERVNPKIPVKLEDYFNKFSLSEILYQLTSVMYIHPGGRGAYLMAKYMDLSPAESLLNIDCCDNLASPVHAHIDYRGNYITGFCSGLRIGEEKAFDLKKLYREGIYLEDYPVLEILTGGGLKELYNFAGKNGYKPKEEGYVAPCHLCLDIRIYLYFKKERYKELYPDFFYEELKKNIIDLSIDN